ncbi:MAG: hypothetical protein P8Y53_13820 [Pseudolabrys sp.]
MKQMIGCLAEQGDIEIIYRDNLSGLGIDQLQDIIEINGDINSLCHAS